MKHLSSDAQRLIAQTRQLDEPTLDDRVRIRTRLDASWSASAHAPGTGAARLAAKLWLTGTSIIAVAGIGIWLASSPDQPPAAVSRPPLAQPSAATTHPIAAHVPEAKALELSTASEPTNMQGARTQRSSMPDPSVRPHAGSGAHEPRAATPKRTRAKARQLASRAIQATTPAVPLQTVISPQPTAAKEHRPSELPSAAQVDGQAAQVQTRQNKRTSAGSTSTTMPVHAVDESAEVFVPDPIADEVSLLGAAQKALRAGQPTRAMNYIQQHAFRFPTGALSQERSAVHALTLCALDRKTAARQVFDDLRGRAPSAAVLARIRHDCGF